MSSAEAFHHYGIKAPPSMRNLRYSAMSTDDTTALVAIFTVSCEEVSPFLSQSALRQVPCPSFDTSDVKIFAERYGWGPPGAVVLVRLYLRGFTGSLDSGYIQRIPKHPDPNGPIQFQGI